jgi:hypothetical protein
MSRPKLSLPIRNWCFSVSPSSVVISPVLPGQQVAAGGVEQRRVDGAQPGRGQRHRQQHQQHHAAQRTEPLRSTRCHIVGC